MSSQSCGFSSSYVWMWELDYKESWALKNWCFWKLWCWRRLLRVLWTVRRSNQPVLKEISPKYSLEGLMLKLEFQYFGHLMRRADSMEKTLLLGKIEGGREEGDNRGWDGWMASPTRWTWVWASSGSWRWTEKLECCSPWGCKESDMTEQLNWDQEESPISFFFRAKQNKNLSLNPFILYSLPDFILSLPLFPAKHGKVFWKRTES